MGFLLFAARKLQLKRQINEMNFRAMLISQEKQTITKQIADFQQGMNNAKNMMNITAQGLAAGAATSIFGADYQTIIANPNNTDKADYQDKMVQYQNSTNAISVGSSIANTVFDAVNKAQLAQLQAKDSELDLEQESIESQTKLLQEEYNSVKQAESQSAKDSAPTFGLA